MKPMKPMKPMKKPRGYLLLEMLIGGSIAAVTIGALVILLANARNTGTVMAKDRTANFLIDQGLEQARSKRFLGLTPTSDTGFVAVTGLSHNYQRRTQVGPVISEVLEAGQSTDYVVVTVSARYRHPSGSFKTHTSSIRVYE